MRWRGRERSRNVQDRRGAGGRGIAIGGGGIVTLLIVLAAIFLGADPRALVGVVNQGGAQPQVAAPGPDDATREFVEVVLRDTEKVWTRLFQQQVEGGGYVPPTLVLYSGTDRSACGMANAAMGPFYCPADQQIYMDPTFFDQLARRHDAPGDFAQAYVIAHEVAHHVQQLIGFTSLADRVRASGDQLASNRASVRLELQADYLAGVWAHHAERDFSILEQGDIAEAVNAANQIGDDKLQRMAQGYVVPERYTHGTSAQRARWFTAGLQTGDLKGAETLFEVEYSEL